MRNTPSQIHSTALGGYTIDGPYFRRRKLPSLIGYIMKYLAKGRA